MQGTGQQQTNLVLTILTPPMQPSQTFKLPPSCLLNFCPVYVIQPYKQELFDTMANYFNLDDRKAFPAWRDLPGLPEDGVLFLAEIQQCDGFGRFRTIVKDLEGKECVVAFYPDSYEDTGFDFKKLKKGHTLAIFNAYEHEFLDGTLGVRVEDMDDVSVSFHIA